MIKRKIFALFTVIAMICSAIPSAFADFADSTIEISDAYTDGDSVFFAAELESDNITGSVIAALYDSASRLTGVKIYAAAETVNINFDTADRDGKARLFWWSDLDEIRPIAESTERELAPLFDEDVPTDPSPEASDTSIATDTPEPTAEPTAVPTTAATEEPTAVPTTGATEEPTAEPTEEPEATSAPVVLPTQAPTDEQTEEPTTVPTTEPTAVPTDTPEASATAEPTSAPAVLPTQAPTTEPTAEPTVESTVTPTAEPTATPTPTPLSTAAPNTVTLSGGQSVMTAPNSLGSVTSAAYTVEVLDASGNDIDAVNIEWSVLPTGGETADDYVTIEDGVITVTKGFSEDDSLTDEVERVKDFTVTVTATTDGGTKSAETTIEISDYLFYEPGIGGSSYGTVSTTADSDGTYYISTPTGSAGTTEYITLPDAIEFEVGTAKQLTFKTTVIHAAGYTFQREVTLLDKSGNSIIRFGYVNLDIGDAATATWNNNSSSLSTVWGSISAIYSWTDVALLFKTNKSGTTTATLTIGDTVTDLGTITATDIAKISTYIGIQNPNRNALLKDIIIDSVDTDDIEISGDSEISTIDGVTVTREYSINASVIQDGETFEWETDIEGASLTVSEDTTTAVLSLPDTVTEGGTITVTSSESAAKTAELDLTVASAKIMSAEINGPSFIDTGAGAQEYTISDVTDQFGEDITDYITPSWSVSDTSAATIDADGVLTPLKDGSITLTAAFTNNGVSYPFTASVKTATYSVIQAADGDSTTVDISAIVSDSAITGYMATTASADCELVNQTEVSSSSVSNGKITVDTTGADKVEIAPIFQGYMNTAYTIPAATYNITVTANNGSRTDVYANEQMILNNVNQGTDNWATYYRTIPSSADYEAEDVVIDEGSVTFNYQDDNSDGKTITAVKFVKSPSIVTRKQRIYVIGDSLVAKYYGDAASGEEKLVRTGWGQVLENYIVEDTAVTNLGNSGAYAKTMYSDAFTNVQASAQAGDIVIWESGYNDRSYSTTTDMAAAINAAISECYEMGVDFYLVTPNASAHDYKDNVVWSSYIREIANDEDNAGKVTLIDLSANSYEFLSGLYGNDTTAYWDETAGTTVADMLQTYYNNTADSLHSSYNAANCWAAIVANALSADYADIADTDYTYTFSDGVNNITASASGLSASEISSE